MILLEKQNHKLVRALYLTGCFSHFPFVAVTDINFPNAGYT
jgi:hypothetical protein